LGYEDVSSESGYILRELLGYLKGIAAIPTIAAYTVSL
jgi:hypothetical protein